MLNYFASVPRLSVFPQLCTSPRPQRAIISLTTLRYCELPLSNLYRFFFRFSHPPSVLLEPNAKAGVCCYPTLIITVSGGHRLTYCPMTLHRLFVARGLRRGPLPAVWERIRERFRGLLT